MTTRQRELTLLILADILAHEVYLINMGKYLITGAINEDAYTKIWNNYLAKIDDPNDPFNKYLDRIYHAPLSEKVSP